ncbi:MAG: hypothetical protein ABI905_05480 [Betaproteobacteria bacterium]
MSTSPDPREKIPVIVKRPWPRRLLRSLITIPLALWVFLEEWVWDFVLAATAWLAKLPPIRWLENVVSKLPPYAAMFVFLVPAALLLPFKLAAFWLIAHGHGVFGLQVFIVAKLLGTALLARIFSLTKNALLTIGWFAKLYFAFTAWKERLYAYVRALPAYQAMRERAQAIKAGVKSWWQRHFRSGDGGDGDAH